MIYDYGIIGAGASGLMLAAQMNIRQTGHTGVILESTRPGSKLLMSGGGHCNITHAGSIKDFVSAYGDAGRALRKCLYKHNNQELMDWLEAGGVKLTVNEEGRVFPASMQASEVLDFLLGKAKANGWELVTGAKVREMSVLAPDATDLTVAPTSGDDTDLPVAPTRGSVTNLPVAPTRGAQNPTGAPGSALPAWLLETADTSYAAASVVIACGGNTYPETGSDGSMFSILRELGVEIEPLKPALAPIEIRDWPYAELSGISVQDVTVTVYGTGCDTCRGKAARMSGDILFTHSGFSGPVILNISQFAEAGETIRIQYNKKIEELPKRLRRALEDRSRGPSGDIKTSKLAGLLDSDNFTVKAIDPRGMVSRGGIRLSEIDTGTMRLRLAGAGSIDAAHGRGDAPGSAGALGKIAAVPEVFAIGEALDATGITGGYNLQLCYSTACSVADYLSGKSGR